MAVREGASNRRPQIMGVINATPDSFYSESRNGSISKAKEMLSNGARWIDIGGESTRPGATDVSIEEELNRVIPLVKEISKYGKVSIDTRHVEVARAALKAGALMVNDVSGLRDLAMLELVIETGCSVCIMHMLGEPGNMQDNPQYENVVTEVTETLLSKADELVQRGHPKELIYLDPGIGFGKLLEHNIALLQSSDQLRPYSILWGVSRKLMIGQICNQKDASERLSGTLAIASFAYKNNIDIIRVHDVREHMDLFEVLNVLEE